MRRRLLNIGLFIDYWPNSTAWGVLRTPNGSIRINAWRFTLWLYTPEHEL